jgi:MFS family permease
MTASKGNSARPPGSCASLALRSYWLLVICLLAISSQTYDWPGAIEPYLRRMIGITGEQLAALYSAYHAPNVIVVILGGILIDVIGPDSASVGFTAIILISSFILASRLSFGVLIISRVLLGIGSESLQIAQMALLNRAFDRRSRKDYFWREEMLRVRFLLKPLWRPRGLPDDCVFVRFVECCAPSCNTHHPLYSTGAG